ncbi:MAG TPA: FAD binding domain-containing protein [Usitatibacter sp.]|nr:FAD binding domain-containing protein [Usitatibacter sp.]
MNRFEWTSPVRLEQALEARTATVASAMGAGGGTVPAPAAVFKAGGTDLLGLVKEELIAPARVVSLRSVGSLDGIARRPDGALAIGANVTLAALAADPAVRAGYRALAQAAGESASPQLRRIATIGGNLLQRPRCWYFRSRFHPCARKGGSTCFAFAGENEYHAIFGQHGCAIVHPSTPATALVALGASVELARAGRAPRTLPLESFFVAPDRDVTRENVLEDGEVLTAIVLPPPRAGLRSAHRRVGELESFDWPIADAAVVLELGAGGECRGASIVLGSAAPVPHRAKAAQSALVGSRVTGEAARRAARAALEGATPLAHNAYKLPVFEALVRRTILEAAGPA